MASSSSSSSSLSISLCSSTFVSQQEFNLFHKIDRQLYTILVINIGRDPMEALQIMAFWLWLERVGFRHVVYRMLQLPVLLINELADEALTALTCIVSDNPPPSSDDYNNSIPLTQNFMKKEISLQFLYANRQIAMEGITKILNEVCFRAMRDIMLNAISHRKIPSSVSVPLPPPPPPLSFRSFDIMMDEGDQVPPEERAMFVTFSKGYPVQEWEVRDFFTINYGDCIEHFQMQEVEPNEQSLFARIVFRSASTIGLILGGQPRMKFTINGKHIWARKFIPKHPPSPQPPTAAVAAVQLQSPPFYP
ncbi:uncharacterized protein LOC111485004 [Cucurbita maxima]|uniref:Uncharacterized protein LOC111485004 n=1 Tax=Cucurbita maxima TaxID=3661 RepID=A0A6J1JEA0_CUCMA|nr:uncharacterized protein LOC111485004 [Cucurbita maxima]